MLVRQGAGRGVHYLVLLLEGTEAFGAELFTAGQRSGGALLELRAPPDTVFERPSAYFSQVVRRPR